jgi:hypothetical protein
MVIAIFNYTQEIHSGKHESYPGGIETAPAKDAIAKAVTAMEHHGLPSETTHVIPGSLLNTRRDCLIIPGCNFEPEIQNLRKADNILLVLIRHYNLIYT